jgi:hypothetical protein
MSIAEEDCCAEDTLKYQPSVLCPPCCIPNESSISLRFELNRFPPDRNVARISV